MVINPRAAVIGCGNVGSSWDEQTGADTVLTHAGAWHRLGLLTALADADPVRLAAAGRYWGITALYSDYRDLLATERPDLVSIATPSVMRLPIIEAALAYDVRAILLEKPIALSISEAQKISNATHAAGTIVAVNYLRRYDTAMRQMAAQVQAGRLGAIQQVIGHYNKGIIENGSHLIDLINWWLGPVHGMRVLRCLSDGRSHHDPTLEAVIEVQSHDVIIPFYLLATDYRHYSLFELNIIGTKGRITISGREVYLQEARPDPIFPSYQLLQSVAELPTNLGQALLRAAEDLLAVWRRERPMPCCTLEDGLAALTTAIALRDATNSVQT